MLRCKHHFKPLAKIPFAYKRASAPFRDQTVARFMNSRARQLSFYTAAVFFDRHNA
jgi:hypothetical protein